MMFDIRLPIGVLFAAIGALVVAVGLTADKAVIEAHAAGLNIDLIWGSVMVAFGVLMVVLSILRRQGDLPPPQG